MAPRPPRAARPLLASALLPALALLGLTAAAITAGTATAFDGLTYIAGSSGKLEQIIGDHDWADTLLATTSQTLTRADVLGNGLGYSFVCGDSLLFIFGDTIGATSTYYPRWADFLDPTRWDAADPIASSPTHDPLAGLQLDFFMAGPDSALRVKPVYPDSTLLAMGADDIPNSGITLDGRIYLVCSTGTTFVNGVASHAGDSSVVVRFDPALQTFTAGRTMSRVAQGGHFVMTSPHEFVAAPGDTEVVIFGVGEYRQSDIYLSTIRKRAFESGLDVQGNPATRYFTALLANGQPAWSSQESQAVPVVQDDPLAYIGVGLPQSPWPADDPPIGNLSVIYSPAVGLWLMTYDGGRQSPPATYLKQTEGVYFSYAPAPWGPWIKPQMIYNGTRDGGYGTFIHEYNHNTDVGIGPAGPTIGSQTSNDPDTTSGAVFAPEMIEPFTQVSGDTLTIYYTMSTWNPYTVVKMRSKFLITPQTLAVPAAPVPSVNGLRAWPDPFSAATRVAFSTAKDGMADVSVFDLAGRRVRRLSRGVLGSGAHELVWDGRADDGAAVRGGVYFVRLEAGGEMLTRRIVRLR